MKKLTAGIFATLLAVVSVGAAHAEIASKGYVDQQVGTKADAATVSSLQGTVSDHTTQIAGKADKATTLAGYAITDGATKTELGKKADSATVTALDKAAEKIANRVTTVSDASDDTHYPTAKAVWDVVKAETSDIASTDDLTALTTRVGTLETASANHVVKNEAITGGTHTKITYDAKGLVTAGANLTADDIPTIPNTKVSGLGSLATKSSVATTDIANKAVTKEKLADAIVTSLGKADTALQETDLADYVTKTAADAAYADIAAEGEIDELQTGKQDKNMGAGAANHVVITDETGNITSAATIEAAKVSGLANVAKTGAYGDLTGTPSLGTLASKSTITSGDITDGTIAEADLNTTINASLDKADSALQQSDIENMQTTTKLTKVAGWEGAKTSDDNYPSNAAVNAAITSATSGLATDSKMGDLSSLTTDAKGNLVGAINEVDANADAAQDAADAAQVDATKAISDAATAQKAAETAQTTAEARIPKPSGECSNPTAKCVLVSNGTNSFEWEVIARDGEGE